MFYAAVTVMVMVAVLLVPPVHASVWVSTSMPHFRSVPAARLEVRLPLPVVLATTLFEYSIPEYH